MSCRWVLLGKGMGGTNVTPRHCLPLYETLYRSDSDLVTGAGVLPSAFQHCLHSESSRFRVRLPR